jgi:hypothetical protein
MTILSKLLTPDARPASTQKASSKTYKAVADAVGTLRLYQDVPLRFQKQWITSFLAAMILVSIIAGLYLNITSRAAITGREIQFMQEEITTNRRTNADLQTKIALLLSSESLKSRAIESGYEPLKTTDLDYMTVPGYFPSQGIDLSAPIVQSEDISVSSDYTESLFSWLARQIEAASLPLAQGQ